MPRDYRFITKDPVIDLLRGECQRVGKLDGRGNALTVIAHDAGIGVGTLRNWFFGDTRRPQNITIRFTLEALGVHTEYRRADGSKIEFDNRKVKWRNAS